MDQETKQNLSNRNIWARLLYMVLFAIAYSLAEAIIFVVALVQFIAVLVNGQTNAALHQFGANLSAYAYQIFEYVTFNSEHIPFPFNEWPEAEVGETPYTHKDHSSANVSQSDPVAAEPVASEPVNNVADAPPASSVTGERDTSVESQDSTPADDTDKEDNSNKHQS